ncbi:hypothetical protein E4198_00040 [Streptomyces sp. RKND-216]|uniref:hypothetical protein n=1 Tax=Streptomyces sp. RKND-216 TaxID=2562581 RepID=UPI00109E1FBB|nr:hypothetical protein [Streptomyces sp. RKND-216]THA28240.1 hypothetical protein E4198_00040 [Streptomyces sp. RKND-216]
MSSLDAVQWWGTWEHPACGASGEDQFADDAILDPDHDCALEGEVVWHAEWDCEVCGSSCVEIFTDGLSASSGHDCDEDQDDDLEEVAA